MDTSSSQLKSCGFLIYRRTVNGAAIGKSFLLMQHSDRWDLPKGHVDRDETETETALRELNEETGIRAGDIRIDDRFRFELSYQVHLRQFPSTPREKTLVVFLAELVRPVTLQVTEHAGFRWFPWQPPHRIQSMTIDPLLEAVAQHWTQNEP